MNARHLLPISLAFAVAACASEPAPRAQAPSTTQAGPLENTWTPQSPQPKWWEAGDSACKDGAKLVGVPPPNGSVLECRLPNGNQHGFSSVWYENGHEGTLTEYANGVRNGRWLYWSHNHPLIDGQFRDGRRDGRWIFWFDAGSGFDMTSRYDRAYNDKNYTIENYNKGLLVQTAHYRDGKPEEGGEPIEIAPDLPEPPRDASTPK